MTVTNSPDAAVILLITCFRAGDDLLLMSTPPPGGKSGAAGVKHPAARALEEQVLIQNALSSGLSPPAEQEQNNVDQLYANSPQPVTKEVGLVSFHFSVVNFSYYFRCLYRQYCGLYMNFQHCINI